MGLDLEEYLKKMIEGYLFGDLKLMSDHPLGFPPLMASFAGIEFLGGLVHPDPFKAHGCGRAYFKLYWSQFLYPSHVRSADEADAIYQLVRHGIAHSFVPKGPIAVGQTAGNHLKRLAANDWIIVDPVALSADLQASYSGRFRDLFDDHEMVGRMEGQLRLMHESYGDQYKQWEKELRISDLFPAIEGTMLTTEETTSAPVSSSTGGPTGPN